jgi:2-C-methyl-D-erythritol 4-phosphate cytidylyltransferase
LVKAIILAAGKGIRMGEEIPKQFLPLKAKPVLWHTLYAFEKSGLIDEIILVINKDWSQEAKNIAKGFLKVKKISFGGKTRQDSVWAGLKTIDKADILLIHDGVRPFVSEKLIKNVIKGAKELGAVVPAIPVKETIKLVEGEVIKKTINRNGLYLAQTPQGFKYHILKAAYLKAQKKGKCFSDDASLLEKEGINVYITSGESQNIKITTQSDLKWAEMLIKCK